MFNSHHLLALKAPLEQIWTAATMYTKIHHPKIDTLNLFTNWKAILNPSVPMALRLSGICKDDVTHFLVEINLAWKVKSATSNPTRLPKGANIMQEPFKHGPVLWIIHKQILGYLQRLDSMDDPFLNQNLQGDQETEDHHQAEVAIITLNDNYDSYQADTTTFSLFERFDVKGGEEMQWDFTQPARQEELPKSDEVLERHHQELGKKQSAENKEPWKVKSAPSDPTKFPKGANIMQEPFKHGPVLWIIHKPILAYLQRLDSMDDPFLNQNLQGDQEKEDHHQAEVAIITLNDNYDSYQAYTTSFSLFERFDVEGDEEMQWNFTQPARQEELPKSDEVLERHHEEQQGKKQSAESKDPTRLPKGKFQDNGNGTAPPVEGEAPWPPLLPSTFPEKGILRVQFDGAYRWLPDKVAGVGYWIRYEFKGTHQFLCAHHCKGEGHPDLLSTNLSENEAGEKGIVRALELRPKKILLVTDNTPFYNTMKSCLLKRCYPEMPGHKKNHDEIDHLKKLESRKTICRILDTLPEDILIKIELTKGKEDNKLAHVLAALGLQGQQGSKFHYSFEAIKAEYDKRQSEIKAMPDGKSKDEEQERLKSVEDSDWEKMKASTKIPTTSETHFICWKGIKGGRK